MLPPVYSTSVSPGEISPSRSAPSTIASAIRSFIEPVGLRSSSLSHSSAPFAGAQCRSRTSGVFPIASRIDSIRSSSHERRTLRAGSDRLVSAQPAASSRSTAAPPRNAVTQLAQSRHRHVTPKQSFFLCPLGGRGLGMGRGAQTSGKSPGTGEGSDSEWGDGPQGWRRTERREARGVSVRSGPGV